MYVFVETLNAHAPTNFTKDAKSIIQPVQYINQPQPRSLDDSGLLHVVELFSPLPIWSTRAWIKEGNKVSVVNNVQMKAASLLI
jgi:hypothetical protein